MTQPTPPQDLPPLFPPAKELRSGAPVYPLNQCLVVYLGEPPADAPNGFDLAGTLAAETMNAKSGRGCAVLAGLPKKPPAGCLIVATPDELAAVYPDLADLPKPPSDQGYVLHLGRFAAIAADSAAGALAGAQSLSQFIPACPDGLAPELTVVDWPDLPSRALAVDVSERQVNPRYLMRLAATIAGFKGNRLHLRLSSIEPLGDSGLPGSFSPDDLEQFSLFCAEYGITAVPWIDLLPLGAAGQISAEEAAGVVASLAEAFGSDAVGLGLDPLEAPLVPAAGEFFHALRAGAGETILYLGAEALDQLWQPEDVGARLIAVIRQPESPPGVPTLWQDREIGFAAWADLGDNGFVPPHPDQLLSRIDAHRQLASALEAGALELGFAAGPLRDGNCCENQLLPLLASLGLGWNLHGDARSAQVSLCRMIYDADPGLFMRLQQTLAGTFPELLRGPGGREARELALGRLDHPDGWRALVELEWPIIQARLDRAERELQDFRRRAGRNVETLWQNGLSLAALNFLGEMVHHIGAARAHCLAAGRGKPGSLAAAQREIQRLTRRLPRLLNQFRLLQEQCGLGREEEESLLQLHERLDQINARLDAAKAAPTPPAPEDLGFPAW